MQMLTTMITPYKADGSIDFDTAEKYVDWYYENGEISKMKCDFFR